MGCDKFSNNFSYSEPDSDGERPTTNVTLKCISGYTRNVSGNDSVTCEYSRESRKYIWSGSEYLVDCELNYCDPPENEIQNGDLINFTMGTPPLKIIPGTHSNANRRFFEGAAAFYKCKAGHVFSDFESVSANKTCSFNESKVGRGKWLPENIECVRMHFILSQG